MTIDQDQELSFNQDLTPVVQRNNPVPVVHHNSDPEQHWWLVDEARNKRYSLDQLPCVIGRSRECSVVVRDKGVSRQHAHIIKEDGVLLIRDLGSTNGIRVNRKRYVECRLFDGDIVGIGSDHEFTIQSRSDPRPSSNAVQKTSSPTKRSSPRKDPRTSGLGFPSYTSYHANTHVIDEADDESIVFDVEDDRSLLSDLLRWIVFFLILVVAGLIARYVFMDDAPTLYPSPKITPQNTPIESHRADHEVFDVHPSVSSLQALSTPPAPIPPPITERPSSLLTEKVPWASTQSPKTNGGTEPSLPGQPPSVPDSRKKRDELQQTAERNYLTGNATDAILFLDQAQRGKGYTPQDKQALSDLKLVYRQLLDQYLEGDRLFKLGERVEAFKVWSEFVKKEKEIFGERKSKYAMKVGKNVTDSLMDSAKTAVSKRQYHKAWRLWEKAKIIGVDERGQEAMVKHEERAIQLYDEAVRLEKTDPDRAVLLLQQVEKLVPPGTEYNAKASGKIDLMRNWGGGPIQ